MECCESATIKISKEEHESVKDEINCLAKEKKMLKDHRVKLKHRLKPAMQEAIEMAQDLVHGLQEKEKQLKLTCTIIGELTHEKVKYLGKQQTAEEHTGTQTWIINKKISSETRECVKLMNDTAMQTGELSIIEKRRRAHLQTRSSQRNSTKDLYEETTQWRKLLILTDDSGKGLLNKLEK